MKPHVSLILVHQDPWFLVLNSDRSTVISAQGSRCPSLTSPKVEHLCQLLPLGGGHLDTLAPVMWIKVCLSMLCDHPEWERM